MSIVRHQANPDLRWTLMNQRDSATGLTMLSRLEIYEPIALGNVQKALTPFLNFVYDVRGHWCETLSSALNSDFRLVNVPRQTLLCSAVHVRVLRTSAPVSR